MRTCAIVLGGLIGAVAGYLAAVYVSCDWFWPDSNLCGLPGVVVGAFGLLGGVTLVGRLVPIVRPSPSPVAQSPSERKRSQNLQSLALVLFGLVVVVAYQFHLLQYGWFLFILPALAAYILYFLVKAFFVSKP